MKNGNFRELGCDGNRAELAFLIGWSLFGLLGAVILAIYCNRSIGNSENSLTTGLSLGSEASERSKRPALYTEVSPGKEPRLGAPISRTGRAYEGFLFRYSALTGPSLLIPYSYDHY